MNLPENLSAAAKKVYELLSNSQTAKSLEAVNSEYGTQPASDEGYKAIATADSLVAKGIISLETSKDENAPEPREFYTLVKSPGDVGPSEEADAKDEYITKTDANEEEKKNDDHFRGTWQTVAATELFDLYMKGQMPDSNTAPPDEELKTALQELTDAGLVTEEGEGYRIKA